MALSDIKQAETLIKSSKYILLIFNSKDNGDALASALAMKTFLEKQHREADVVCDDFKAPKQFNFLHSISTVKPALANLQKFIIKVDVSKTAIESLSYDIKDSVLSIYLTPKDGIIGKNELRTAQSTFKYDLIITFNTPDLDSLRATYQNNTDLFHRTPIIAIDHLPNNERYGKINLVDLSATSTSEIVFKLIKEIDEQYLDANLCTTLLTGITIATGSFKSPNLSPSTMQIASDLMARGADLEKIMQNLYRTRSISTLRLWGQALSHLQSDTKIGLVSTSLTKEDFSRSGGTPEDLRGIIDELLSNSPEAKVILLLYEMENIDKTNLPAGRQIGGIIASEKNFDALHLARPFHPEGTKHLATFLVQDKTLKEAEDLVMKSISEALPIYK